MSSLRDQHILVIEDDPQVMFLVKKILEGDGATVSEATSVDSGLVLAKNRVPNLIITDLNLPNRSGFDFLIERQSSQLLNETPTIVLSGMKDKESVTRAIGVGATDYVVKPFRATLLLQKVRRALKTASFYTYRFSKDEAAKAEISVSIELLKLSEVGIEIESSVKLAPEQEVVLSSELLEQIGVSEALTRTVKKTAHYISQGRYRNEVGFYGTDQAFSKRIRTFLKSIP
jgi:DNA-binding response OmpR family regulator